MVPNCRRIAKMEMQQVLHMRGGDDYASYAKNSSFQKLISMKVSNALKRSIQEFCRANLPAAAGGSINIADLGCASGPNTLLAIQDIIQNIDRECHDSNIYLEPPTIQVFLNDLVSNDFNSVFQSLPSFYGRLEKCYGRRPGSCFIAAMPGSFHGRLFPDNSMHFVHSSYSLHWLSQVPSGLVTAEGLPLNKGNIYIGKTSPRSVHAAYLDQFDKDLTNFLSARAAELVAGGHLFLTLSSNNDDPLAYNYHDLLGMTMNDMVTEGLIERKAVDTFNLPHYQPSLEELKTIIEKNRAFKIGYLDIIEVRWVDVEATDYGKNYVFDKNSSGKYIARSLRAVYEPIIRPHFGDGIIDDFFSMFATKISQYHGKIKDSTNNLVASLSRI